ncbi:hypothetical protein HN695_03915 [Candidatus Woesearchaeota archaeon]|jgi:hypothetical protein|nr:hypothetical protein [Candidatus Woesearchaeota archaeon]MBT5272296.1 hypothetical protein [Candidatus Woesearchaeota archaeon]MBT6040625.1 hypothetical protein [Candidatus Woesearchaeota archaeon]MBT6336568.1 hypothetical protein [Candidatus Woesearchaeota archaeon]MBT7927458.1 hypothetical protein [Candidatus Woesearchaeota archaeon]
MAKILLADDSAFMRKILVNVLNKEGYKEIIETSDGAATLLVRNNFKDTISVGTIALNGVDLDTTGQILTAGETVTFSADNEFSSLCNGGDSFSVNISIVYNDTVTDSTYTFTGDGHNLEGECSE